jgi:hypothetical protein
MSLFSALKTNNTLASFLSVMLCPVTTDVDVLQLLIFLLLLSVSTRASVLNIKHASSVVPATAFFHTSAC